MGGKARRERGKFHHSFSVNTSLGQAEATAISYQVASIPTLAIGGKYVVTGNHEAMLAVSDELIAKVRAEDKKTRK
jgi:predicted DsbA family dithiol-disulfide isomerase